MSERSYHLAVSAGAGTGKTYSLVENYVSALFGLDKSGVKKRPEHILALTFTQKAAQEMRVRIAKRLNGFLTRQSGEKDPAFDGLVSRDEIKRLLRALPNAHISTFHGFCADLLRQEARALDIREQFQLLMPQEEKHLAQNIMRPLILSRIKEPNKAIRSLVARFRLSSNPLSLGLIDALLSCYAKLSEFGLDVCSWMKIHNADEESETLLSDIDRIKATLSLFVKASPKVLERLSVVRELLELFEHEGYASESKFMDLFVRLKGTVKGNFGERGARHSLVDAVHMLGAHAVDHFVREDEHALSLVLEDFHHEFAEAKHSIGMLSYNDLLEKIHDHLCLDVAFRRRLKQRFMHILIDEYQDTSPVQEQIIAYLCENKDEEQPLRREQSSLLECNFKNGASLFVVGDKKQSIYGFRGADTGLFDRMLKKMARSHAGTGGFERRLLTINRRSAPRLIKLINLVASSTLTDQGYDHNEDLEPHEDLEGTAELWLNANDQDLDKTQANLLCAAHGIKNLLQTREDMRAKDIVVLVRRTRSGVAIKGHLAKLGISARIVGGEGFFQEQAVVDILAALKLLNDPHHILASAIVLRSPLVLLTDQDVLLVHRSSEQGGLSFEKAKEARNKGVLSEEGTLRLANFMLILERVRLEIMDRGLAWAVDLMVSELDLAFWWGLMDDGAQASANVHKLRSMLSSSSQNPFQTIEEYFQFIFHNPKEPQALGDSLADFVTIMTIHQSKGLEFKAVVLADGESSLPPLGADIVARPHMGLVVRPKGRLIRNAVPEGPDGTSAATRFQKVSLELRRSEKEEMARLLYVALTRAKTDLYVVSSQASFVDRGHQKSLLDLFYAALRKNSDEFFSLCSIREIDTLAKAVLSTSEHSEESKAHSVYSHQENTIRFFSSGLKAPAFFSYAPFINRQVGKASPNVDGALAHQLLADAGSLLCGFTNVDRALIEHVTDAALRAKGPYSNAHRASNTKKACVKTLALLHQTLLLAERIMFEMPIVCWPHEGLLIEGFADLVLEFDDFIGVVEFKSSASLAVHPDTYMQMFAYAHGLCAHNKKPIKCASILVGSALPIFWHDYSDTAKRAFKEALEGELSELRP